MASNVYDFNLPAAIGGAYVLNVQGNQALVKSAAGGTVELLTEKGERYVCDEGQGFQLPEGQTFRQLRIVNRQAVANAGLIFVGDDSFIDKRITGNVTVIDSVGANTQLQSATFLAVTALQATAIVTPAQNVNGVILRGYSLDARAGASGNADCRLMAAPSAPTATFGTQMALLGRVVDAVGTVQVNLLSFDLRKRIPAGWGLYHVAVNQVAASINNAATCCFEIL